MQKATAVQPQQLLPHMSHPFQFSTSDVKFAFYLHLNDLQENTALLQTKNAWHKSNLALRQELRCNNYQTTILFVSVERTSRAIVLGLQSLLLLSLPDRSKIAAQRLSLLYNLQPLKRSLPGFLQ